TPARCARPRARRISPSLDRLRQTPPVRSPPRLRDSASSTTRCGTGAWHADPSAHETPTNPRPPRSATVPNPSPPSIPLQFYAWLTVALYNRCSLGFALSSRECCRLRRVGLLPDRGRGGTRPSEKD